MRLIPPEESGAGPDCDWVALDIEIETLLPKTGKMTIIDAAIYFACCVFHRRSVTMSGLMERTGLTRRQVQRIIKEAGYELVYQADSRTRKKRGVLVPMKNADVWENIPGRPPAG